MPRPYPLGRHRLIRRSSHDASTGKTMPPGNFDWGSWQASMWKGEPSHEAKAFRITLSPAPGNCRNAAHCYYPRGWPESVWVSWSRRYIGGQHSALIWTNTWSINQLGKKPAASEENRGCCSSTSRWSLQNCRIRDPWIPVKQNFNWVDPCVAAVIKPGEVLSRSNSVQSSRSKEVPILRIQFLTSST